MEILDDISAFAVERYGATSFQLCPGGTSEADIIKIKGPSVGGGTDTATCCRTLEDRDFLVFQTLNSDECSGCPAIESPGKRAAFEDLVSKPNTVNSIRGDAPTRLGADNDDVEHLIPRIVRYFLTEVAMTGPREHGTGLTHMVDASALCHLRFAAYADRSANRTDLDGLVERTTSYQLDGLRSAGIPYVTLTEYLRYFATGTLRRGI
ncbi:hypothetical protein [Mycolicibacterium iranicum]|uniref:hypothetical protein n=1 Tax=Mycolicibacterium iranicum TaxID=912594 RepID=UPI0004654391|nr:hypothetical protein [Mycolicibacterium iranicum]